MTRAHYRRRTGEAALRAEKFGDMITADQEVLGEDGESGNNHRLAVVVQDLATQWKQSCPRKTKTSQETEKSLRKFLEPSHKPKATYTDTSLEFGKSCEDLSWNHRTRRSETHGIAERAVRRIKEGTSAELPQSGLDEKWWADSVECYCHLRNVQDLLADGKTPYESRFEEPFKGPTVPFGAMVEYYPISSRDQSRLHQFGKKVLPDIFLGYALIARGTSKGDIVIADIEELVGRIGNLSSKNQCKRSIDATKEWTFYIPSSTWTEEYRGFQPTETQDDAEAGRETSGRCKVTSSIVITLNLEFSTLYAERRNIPKSTEIHWRDQSYLYKTGRVARKTCWRLLECWRESKFIRFMENDSRISLYWKKNLPTDTSCPGEDWQRFKRLPDQIMHGQKFGPKLVEPLRIEKNKNGKTRNQSSIMLESWGEFTSSIRKMMNTKKPSQNSRKIGS